jgi:DNA-binding transcriptional LysR family regulator
VLRPKRVEGECASQPLSTIRDDLETLYILLHNVPMILDGVDVFARVVEAGGFSAAARQLGMPVTTVSAKIARLEERLGVTLIQRSTRKMHVTEAGNAYYRHCADAMAALAVGEEELAAATAEPSGLLRITVPSDLAQALLPPIIGAYLARYPKVSVEVLSTNTQLDLLAEGIDLALRASPALKDSTLQMRKFGTARLKLYASPAYLKAHGTPRKPEDLKRHEILVHSRFPPKLGLVRDGRDRFEIVPGTRVRVDDMHSVRALAAHGLGVALLPEILGDVRDGSLVPVLPAFATQTGTLNFVFPGSRHVPVNVRAFIDLALEVIGS